MLASDNVTRALEGVSGVIDIDIDLDTGRAVVAAEPGRGRVDELLLAIQHAGYRASVVGNATGEHSDQYLFKALALREMACHCSRTQSRDA